MKLTICVAAFLLLCLTEMRSTNAETALAADSVDVGSSYVYESCWTRVRPNGVLERQISGSTAWKTVAKASEANSKLCKVGFKLFSYTWVPRTAGKFRLRERYKNEIGSGSTFSKPWTVIVTPKVLNPTATTTSKSPLNGNNLMQSSSGLQGCSFNGKKLWGRVYFTNFESAADVRVSVSKTGLGTQLDVWLAASDSFATSCGNWYVTQIESQADLKVYVSKFNLSYDITISYVSSSSFAGLR